MSGELYIYDPAKALEGAEAVAIFIADAFETGDPAYITRAMEVGIKALSLVDPALDIKLVRDHLAGSLNGEGNPTLKTMLVVARALGLKIVVEPIG